MQAQIERPYDYRAFGTPEDAADWVREVSALLQAGGVTPTPAGSILGANGIEYEWDAENVGQWGLLAGATSFEIGVRVAETSVTVRYASGDTDVRVEAPSRFIDRLDSDVKAVMSTCIRAERSDLPSAGEPSVAPASRGGEIYKEKGDRYFTTVDASWSAYRKAIERLARELGNGTSRTSWVQAIDRSVTPSRASLDDAVAVLEADGLGFDYSFTSLSTAGDDSITIHVWKEQRRVMIVARASSASRSKGLVALGTSFLENSGGRQRSVAIESRAPLVSTPPAEAPDRAEVSKRGPHWAVKATIVSVIGAVVSLGFAYLNGWLEFAGLMP